MITPKRQIRRNSLSASRNKRKFVGGVTHLEVPPEADGDEEDVETLKAVDHVEDPLAGGQRNT